METYLYSLHDELFQFDDPRAGEYVESLDSPCDSTDSDIENHIIYDPQPNSTVDPSYHHIHTFAPSSYLLSPHLSNKAHGSGGNPPVKKVFQRRAANMRERQRMRCINNAFETLRGCIPSEVQSDRKLSKVDTLRLAMRYITYLSQLLQSCGDQHQHHVVCAGHVMRGHRTEKKVIVRSQLAVQDGELHGDDHIMLSHSLSWNDPKSSRPGPDCKLVARIWIPENPTASDYINLASYSCDY